MQTKYLKQSDAHEHSHNRRQLIRLSADEQIQLRKASNLNRSRNLITDGQRWCAGTILACVLFAIILPMLIYAVATNISKELPL